MTTTLKKKPKRLYGGHILLEKYGSDWFKKLAKKRYDKIKKQKAFYEKMHPEKK